MLFENSVDLSMVGMGVGGGPRDGQFDDIVFADLDASDVESFEKEVTNGSLVDVRRKGKYVMSYS